MSTGKLKAQYNRVRTSTALHTTSIWSNTIGIQEDQAGTNQAVEAQIYAPGGAGGGGRHAKRQRAQELIQAAGYQPAVTDYEGLKALARAQHVGGGLDRRGACKRCGGLGHRTNQCRNAPLAEGGAAAAEGRGPGGLPGSNMDLLEAEEEERLLFDSDSDLSSSDSDSSGSDSGERRRKKRKHHSSSGKEHKKDEHKKDEHKKKKHKKEKHKKDKRKKEKSSKRHKSDRKSRSRSRSPARSR